MQSGQIKMAADAGIYFPTILPLFDSPPDQKAMEQWVSTQEPELRALAKKIVANINYVNFEKFMMQLRLTIKDFNDRDKEPYVLWIAQNKKFVRDGFSDAWVAGLALEYCGLRWPEAIVYTDDLPKYIVSHPDIKNFLLLDDAAYSGNHLRDELNAVRGELLSPAYAKRVNDINFIIGIPFMTKTAENIVTTYNGYKSRLQMLKHAAMKQMNDILNKHETEQMNSIGLPLGNRGLTYLAHRFADIFSVFQHLITGESLLSNVIVPEMKKRGFIALVDVSDHKHTALKVIQTPEEWNSLVAKLIPKSNPLVPDVIPPYHLEYKKGLGKLATALQKHTHGQRTSYLVPERLTQVRQMLTNARISVEGTPFQFPAGVEETKEMQTVGEKESKSIVTVPASLDDIQSVIRNHSYILGRGLWSGRTIEDTDVQFKGSTGARDVFNIIKTAKLAQAAGKVIDEREVTKAIRIALRGKLSPNTGFFCLGERTRSTAILYQNIVEIANNIDKRLQR